MSASIGSSVSIYMDTTQRIRPGDYIQTPTGRTYEVETVRIQERGIHEGRQHLRVTVVPAGMAEGSRIIPIAWYPRRKRRK